jgi:hypothetical protein
LLEMAASSQLSRFNVSHDRAKTAAGRFGSRLTSRSAAKGAQAPG